MKTILLSRLSSLRVPAAIAILALACFGLLTQATATPDPPTVGGGGNTADGELALANPSLSGFFNVAIGYEALYINSTGDDNTAVGAYALYSNNTGVENTGIGKDALQNNEASFNTAVGVSALFLNTSGTQNTAIGRRALYYNVAGGNNTATGYEALFSNKTTNGVSGFNNTANGAFALFSNLTGNSNTAVGGAALYSNTADNNTATGLNALYSNNVGTQNTATGVAALQANTGGNYNTAHGAYGLASNVSHSYNTASGFGALQKADADDNTATGALSLNSDTSGYYNTAHGVSALFSNTTGYYNTASGVSALYYNVAGHDNTADGLQALVHNKGNNNVGLGSNAGANLTTGSNNIEIGANVTGAAGETNTIHIGKQGTQKSTFIAGIAGTAVTGSTVVVSSTGKLGVASSSARFKDGIKPMDKASEAVLALKPITFHYKEEVDPDQAPQFGLVAEEVEKVDPQLVVHDDQGKPFTVRYEAVNAMLLNEFLKEHRIVQQQASKLQQQDAVVNHLEAMVTEQARIEARQNRELEQMKTALRKVSEQVQTTNPARLVTHEN